MGDDQNTDPSTNYLHQLGELTKSVSQHQETLSSLKDVPELLKSLMKTFSPRSDDEEAVNDSLIDEEVNVQDGDAEKIYEGLDFEDSQHDLNSEDELLEGFNDLEKSMEVGPAISSQVANGIVNVIKRPLSKQTLTVLQDKLKLPANCTDLAVPKMNQEIWNHLPTRAKLNDLNLQANQQTMAYGLITLANLGDMLTKNSKSMPKEVGKSMISAIMDGANLLGQGIQNLNQKRRSEVKGLIQPEYAGICGTTVPVTTYLFGDDLKESLKSSKTASSVLRQATYKRKFNQFRGSKPYTRTPFHQKQGNRYNPPPQFQRRGGGTHPRASSSFHNQNYQTRQPFQK